MPLSAGTLLRAWSRPTRPSLPDAHAELARVAAAPDRVRRARRALPLALAAIPPLFLIAFTALVMLPTMNRFFNPEASQMLAFLEMLYQQNPRPESRLANPDVRRAMETYIAGRHGARLKDPGFWDSPVMRNVSNRLRKTAEGVAARHPAVSAEELRQATATIAPELERRRQRPRENIGDIAGIMIMAAGTFGLLPALLLSLLWSPIVRGGLLTRMVGRPERCSRLAHLESGVSSPSCDPNGGRTTGCWARGWCPAEPLCLDSVFGALYTPEPPCKQRFSRSVRCVTVSRFSASSRPTSTTSSRNPRIQPFAPAPSPISGPRPRSAPSGS